MKRVVVIDNYDSFTYNLVQYLLTLGAEVEVRLNDCTTPSDVLAADPRGVLISPGPGTPASCCVWTTAGSGGPAAVSDNCANIGRTVAEKNSIAQSTCTLTRDRCPIVSIPDLEAL